MAGREPTPGEAAGPADPVAWAVRIRPAVREGHLTGSHRFLSWCDELGGIRFACPRCGRHKAVLRRVRPAGCRPVHWLLCLSVADRRGNVMSDEVVHQLMAGALGPDRAGRLLGHRA